MAEKSAVLLSRPADIRYFSGYDQFLVPEEREGFLLICKTSARLIHPAMSTFVKQADILYTVGYTPERLSVLLRKFRAEDAWQQLYVDESSLLLDEYRALVEGLGESSLRQLDRKQIWQQRMIKSEDEQRQILKAFALSKRVFKQVKKWLKPGVTELETARKIEKLMQDLGGWPPAFPTIVAFGAHTALPHYQPQRSKLKENQAVLLDFGATKNGYRSDFTRSFWYGGQPPQLYSQIELTVKKAYQAAEKELQTGQATAQSIDRAAREVIKNAGFGEKFIHTTGHGLGLEIHEPPSLNSRNNQPILAGMALTIEPGIYLEGKFGYRYENTLVAKWT